MKIQLRKSKLKAGMLYKGCITAYYVRNNKLRVAVCFDKEPEKEYYKVESIDEDSHSRFAALVKKLDLVDENGEVDLDEMEGLAIRGSLREGSDGSFYVNRLEIDWAFYKEQEEKEKTESEESRGQ